MWLFWIKGSRNYQEVKLFKRGKHGPTSKHLAGRSGKGLNASSIHTWISYPSFLNSDFHLILWLFEVFGLFVCLLFLGR